jgi:MoxR-like ATPase
VEKIMAMSSTHTMNETNGVPTAVRPVVAREIREVEQRMEEASRWIAPLQREMGRVIVGQKSLVDRLLLGLLTNGHILLAGCIQGARFGRIQFTPDMLPSDITGTTIYHGPTASFQVKHGPVFANLVLADEVNRAPAKVQSALLEAMQERQVTLGDASFPLPDPFLVLATQNPLEQEGTYPLPEAQIDRFMLKVVVKYPTIAEERAILDSMAVSRPQLAVSPVATLDTIVRSRGVVDEIYVDDAIRDYIVRVVTATRESGRPGGPIAGLLRAGASPRGTIALTMAARGWAFLQGRGYVVPEDVKALAPDVLRHRVTLSFDAEAQGIDGDEIVRRILGTVVSP